MKRAKVSELKARLSAYLALVRSGESVIVCDRMTPIARLIPLEEPAEDLRIEEPRRPPRRAQETETDPPQTTGRCWQAAQGVS